MRKLVLSAVGMVLLSAGSVAGGCLNTWNDCTLFYNCSGGQGGGGTGGGTGLGGHGGATGGSGGNTTTDSCADGVKNGDETDLDCGGPPCAPCDQGKACVDENGAPVEGACADPWLCVDGVCCDKMCTDKCESCEGDKTGQEPGVCAPIVIGTDPDQECEDGGTEKCELTGACGVMHACAVIGCVLDHASSQCEGQACSILGCEAGWDDCNQQPGDGCEVNLTTIQSCGACGKVCDLPHATPTCTAGACAVQACTGNYGNCDDNDTNGCETDLETDVAHCNACSTPCGFEHAGASCINGQCVMGNCETGYANCNNNPEDGCETQLATNVNHCGSCGRACSDANVASKSCSGGACNSTCVLGFANCNPPVAGQDDGCERDVNGNDGSCGGCGNDCSKLGGNGNADFECDAGLNLPRYCGCSSQTGECDTDGAGPATGSCGAFGICICNAAVCNVGEACAWNGTNSLCSCQSNANGAACAAGETCCQTPAGCHNLTSDPDNCGACGHACPALFACSQSKCVCDGDADCDAGGGGACVAGHCLCGATTCDLGQRCQPGGACG